MLLAKKFESRVVCSSFIILATVLSLAAKAKAQAKAETDVMSALRLPSSESKGAGWLYNTLAANYILLNTVDLLMTYHTIENGAIEKNPLLRSFIDNKPVIIGLKAGMTCGVLFTLSKVKRHHKTIACLSLGLLNIIYGIVVSNNISVYIQLHN